MEGHFKHCKACKGVAADKDTDCSGMIVSVPRSCVPCTEVKPPLSVANERRLRCLKRKADQLSADVPHADNSPHVQNQETNTIAQTGVDVSSSSSVTSVLPDVGDPMEPDSEDCSFDDDADENMDESLLPVGSSCQKSTIQPNVPFTCSLPLPPRDEFVVQLHAMLTGKDVPRCLCEHAVGLINKHVVRGNLSRDQKSFSTLRSAAFDMIKDCFPSIPPEFVPMTVEAHRNDAFAIDQCTALRDRTVVPIFDFRKKFEKYIRNT